MTTLYRREQIDIREQALHLSNREGRIALVEAANRLQQWNIATVLIVVDQDAFALKKLKLVFADAQRYTIRYGFVDADSDWWWARQQADAGGAIEGNSIWNGVEDECGIGETYRADGVVGMDLYNIQDLI